MRTVFILLVALLALTCGSKAQDPQPPLDWDPIKLDSVEPIAINKRADIPRQLARAIARTDCRFDDALLQEQPITIFRPAPNKQAFAIVTCEGRSYSSRLFRFSKMRNEPEPYCVPIL